MNSIDKRTQLSAFVRDRILIQPGQQIAFQVSPPVQVGFQATTETLVSWFTETESLGAVLADDAGFRALQLGTWLNTPDGELISEAVAQVLPPAYRPEYQLVTDALKYAAKKQREGGVQRAVGVGVVAGGVLLILRLLGGG